VDYSIDTSALLDGWLRYYPPDTFGSLWDRLDELIASGSLRATEEVRFELEKKDDDVLAWASEREDLFVELDEQIQWVVSGLLDEFPKLLDTRANRSAADPFVIALATLNECAVVTGEHATECINLLTLFRREGWRF